MSTTARTAEPVRAPADRRLRRIWEAVERPDVKVVSADLFDTLVWRQVAEPADAFALVAARLLEAGGLDPKISEAAFGVLRRTAEMDARLDRARDAGDMEVRLDEVYARMPAWMFGPGGSEAALDAELDLERDILVPDLDVAAVLRAAGEAGKRVVAVSDTYFTTEHLKRLFDQPGLRDVPLRIFASCEHRIGKSGGLFEKVIAELGVAPEQIVHFGDNAEADIEYPAELGIECHGFERSPAALEPLLDGERRLARVPPSPRRRAGGGRPAAEVAVELTSLRGKVAARSEGAELPQALRPFWEHGAVALGPVLTGFAEWVQEQAAETGAGHLHCFMREGALLGSLIDRAGEYMGTGIRTSPLWLNRAVLARATIGTGSAKELEPLLVRRRTPTVERYLASLGVSVNEMPRFAGHAGTSLDDPTTLANLLNAIEEDDAVRGAVVAAARVARDRVVRYVEGLLGEDRRLTVVDLGWAASAQDLLRSVLAQAGIEAEVTGYYLATHEGAARNVLRGTRIWGYLGDLGEPADAVKLVLRSPEILEQACMPPHASQVDLSEDLEPVLAEDHADPVQRGEVAAVQGGIAAFQREWARYRTELPGKLGSLGAAPDVVRPLLLRAVVAPTEVEAQLFGNWTHDENQGSADVEAIAPSELAGHLRHLDPDALRRLPMQDLYWPFGLASRVDSTWGDLMTAAAAGELEWAALSGEADTGEFRVRVADGTDVPEAATIEVVPRRNRFGLSFVRGSLAAPAIRSLGISPCEHPAVVRIDFLEARCWVQGRREPVVIRLEQPQDFGRLQRANCFVLNPNVFVAHSSSPTLLLDLVPETAASVFRVDFSCGFATIAIGELLATPGRLRNVEEAGVEIERLERHLGDLRSSVSWRATKPLRAAKRLMDR